MLVTGRCGAGAQNVTENRALALMMAREYSAATTPLDKALIFRTLLLTGCAGSFNALCSGDGFTYTGAVGEGGLCELQSPGSVLCNSGLAISCALYLCQPVTHHHYFLQIAASPPHVVVKGFLCAGIDACLPVPYSTPW
jgi:hypothetical protein